MYHSCISTKTDRVVHVKTVLPSAQTLNAPRPLSLKRATVSLHEKDDLQGYFNLMQTNGGHHGFNKFC